MDLVAMIIAMCVLSGVSRGRMIESESYCDEIVRGRWRWRAWKKQQGAGCTDRRSPHPD